jgi:hypothetical protein
MVGFTCMSSRPSSRMLRKKGRIAMKSIKFITLKNTGKINKGLKLIHMEDRVIVRDGHGGGWSRKINAWHLYTLMVYL